MMHRVIESAGNNTRWRSCAAGACSHFETRFPAEHQSPAISPQFPSGPNTPLSNSPAPAAMASVQRGVFALVGLFKFHSISLCGRLYPLPRRTTFHFRNALYLIEARNSVAYVRGIFQRLLALLGESELGYGYPITSWFG